MIYKNNIIKKSSLESIYKNLLNSESVNYIENMYNNINWKPIINVGASIGIPFVASKLIDIGHNVLTESLNKTLKENKSEDIDFNKIINKAKEIANIKHIPHSEIKGYENAAYVPPDSIPEQFKKGLKNKATELLKSNDVKKQGMGNFILKTIDYSENKTGGIIIGSNTKNPAVAAHELGHAIIHENGGIENFIQTNSDLISKFGKIGIIGGIGTNLLNFISNKQLLNPNLGNMLFYGGIGTYGLGVLGNIYTEYLASKKAKDLLTKQDIMKDGYSNLLNQALGTYATSKDVSSGMILAGPSITRAAMAGLGII